MTKRRKLNDPRRPKPQQNELADNISFLAEFVEIKGFARVPLKPPYEPRSLASHSSLVLEDNRYVRPSDMDDRRIALEQRWERIEQAEQFGQRVRSILGCDKTYRVLEALADGQIRQVEIATLLGRTRCDICREVKRLHNRIRDNWAVSD